MVRVGCYNSMDSEAIGKVVPPECPNGQPAIMVCLSPHCGHYAFFCLSCEDEKCEGVHQHKDHQDKLETMGFKQFLKRVLKPREPSEALLKATTTYRETLERLKRDVNEFVEKELASLEQMMDEASTLPMEVQPILLRLQRQEYSGLLGKEMDFLWSNCGQSKESIQAQADSAEFIAIKEEELKAIS